MPIPVRNTSWTGIEVVLLHVLSGAPFTGPVAVWVDGDATGRVPGQANGGAAIEDGHGVYHYTPTVAETNYTKVAFTFQAAFCRPETVTYATLGATEQQTVSLARTGTGQQFGLRGGHWPGLDVQLVTLDGTAFITGPCTVSVNGDNTGFIRGHTSGGIAAGDALGVHTYVPTTAETDYAKVSFLFEATGAIPQLVTVVTIPAQPKATTTTGQMSVQTLIRLALRRINVIQAGQTWVSPAYLTDAFLFLNLMLDAWQTETLTKPYLQVSYAMLNPPQPPGVAIKGMPSNPYLVGPGGDFNIIRPTEIHGMNYQDNNQTPPLERPLTPLTRDAYRNIPLKQLTNPLPGCYYYQPTYEHGYGAIFLWMVPTRPNLLGVLYTLSPIPQFATLNDVVILPPSYALAVVDNLAVMLSGTFRENLPLDPTLAMSAATAKANLKRMNIEVADLSVDPALTLRRGIYNIFSDGQSGRP